MSDEIVKAFSHAVQVGVESHDPVEGIAEVKDTSDTTVAAKVEEAPAIQAPEIIEEEVISYYDIMREEYECNDTRIAMVNVHISLRLQ
jgi:hypothetical protein